jgi:hypothetical protein
MLCIGSSSLVMLLQQWYVLSFWDSIGNIIHVLTFHRNLRCQSPVREVIRLFGRVLKRLEATKFAKCFVFVLEVQNLIIGAEIAEEEEGSVRRQCYDWLSTWHRDGCMHQNVE